MKHGNSCKLALTLVFLSASPAFAEWKTLEFDLTKNDRNAYVTDIPAGAFTRDGLKLAVKPGVQYSLMSRKAFSGELCFDLQFEVAERSEKGEIWIDLALRNDQKRRKVLGSYRNTSLKPGTDSGQIRYYKDRKPTGFRWEGRWRDSSTTTGYGKGVMEWLRLHMADKKVWFIQRLKGDQYRWAASANYPRTTYFKEDCESFKAGFVVRSSRGATGTVRIKALKISGASVLPRDTQKRIFLFDFGPVGQELEDGFCPVSEYTMYTAQKGYGWIVPEPEKIWRGRYRIPRLSDAESAAAGLPPIPQDVVGWRKEFTRRAYWLQLNDKKLFYATSHGWDYIEFFRRYLDIKTPLQRDFVGMARSYHFAMDPLYQKDVEERRGSIYIDDDLSTEFVVDLPNGRYNLILGVGYSASLYSGGEGSATFNVEIEGKVRKKGLGPYWRRTHQHPIRNVTVTDGQMNIRFFCDVRKAMDKWANHDIGTGWMINYLLVLPAEQRELMSAWEWKIIKRRGEIIRRVTFVKGDPAVTRNEGSLVSLNGRPLYLLKLMNNYHPGTTEHFAYYCLANCLSAFHSVRNSQHFFKRDWKKLSYSDDYPWQTIDRMNVAYTWHYLTTLHQEGILSFVPRAVSGEGTPTVDARGRSNRYNIQPPLNSALGKEIQREAYTMMSNQLKLHPANAGHFVYEELWHPETAGYDDQSLIQYWDWLRRKYQTIEALNADWGRGYKSFEDILQPRRGRNQWWQHTPEFVNFRTFRGWAQREMVRQACELVRQLEPGHFSWGAKGDFGTQSWYTGEFLDMFGWYTPYVAASVARHFGRAAICGGYLLNCEFAYLDGRKQFNHKPGPRRYRGREEVERVYNRLISSVFKGAKGFYNEWYSNGMCHVFHRTAYIREAAPKFRIKHWTGQLAFFEPEAYEGPPVKMSRTALYACRANQLLYRLAPLWLPARPLEPKVLFPTTEASFYLRFFGPRPYADFETVAMRILRSANIPADFVNLSAVGDLSRYQLIILGDTTQSISRRDARRIQEFVRNGGKLIIMNAGGFSDDSRPRRFWRKKDEVYPLEEFAGLGGYRLVAEGPYHRSYGKAAASFVKCGVAPELATGARLGEYEISCYYEPRDGSQVFLKATLPKSRLLRRSKEVALGLLNRDRNVAVVNFPPKGASDELVRPLARWFRKLLELWKIDRRATFDGIDDAWDLCAGCLVGDGYTLAAVCNLSQEQRREVPLKLSFLPPGDYAVVDVTGDRPDLVKKPDGGLRLRSDPSARRVKIDHRISSQELAERGIPCDVKPSQAQVFLIRPANARVWVSMWKPSLRGLVRRPLAIAHGTGAGERPGAEAIQAALAKLGVRAPIVATRDVKLKKIRHEVRVNPWRTGRRYREDTSAWYLVDVFDNEVVDTDRNLILVGSEATNALVRHLGSEGAFAYDKVLEKITTSYPGPGRGIIATVECINSPTYDLRSQSRDAIIVGGSDAEGTKAAVGELIGIIRKYLPGAPRAKL